MRLRLHWVWSWTSYPFLTNLKEYVSRARSGGSSDSNTCCERGVWEGSVRDGNTRGNEENTTTSMMEHVRSTTQVIRAMAKCIAKSYRESVSRHADLVGWVKSRHHMSEKHVSDLLGCMIIQAECRAPRESLEKMTTLDSLDIDLVSTRCQYEMNFLKSKVKSFLFEDAKSSDMFLETLDECKCLQATLYSYRQPMITLTSSSSSSRHISKIHEPRTKSYDDIRAICIQKQINLLRSTTTTSSRQNH